MELFLCIIAAEAMTQLACKAEIFDNIREWAKSLSSFTDRLLSCPYCVSVWIAAFATILYITYEYSYPFIILLTIHRGSNFVHDLFRIVFNFKVDQYIQRGK